MPLAYKSVRASEEGRKFLENLLDGFRYVRSHRGIVATLLVTVVMNVWGFVYMAMVPAIGEGSLGLSAFPIGVLVAAEGVGAMLGALWLAFYGQPRYYTKYYFFGPVIFFVAILLFANSHIFVVSLIILLIGGFGMAGFSTMQSTIPFLQSDPAMRARVMGLLSVSIGSGPVGMLHVGLLANTFGATTAVTIIAVEGLIALALVYVLWPEAR
jgi:predicted MFS family arabinose efflux permease